tara:strand:+ start:38 stop:226 length:189 start_codon:yes stop_codon:yes gene_type:complete
MNNVILYLFIGVGWVALLDWLAYILQPNNHFTSPEKVLVALFWPLTFIMFAYIFLQSLTKPK